MIIIAEYIMNFPLVTDLNSNFAEVKKVQINE